MQRIGRYLSRSSAWKPRVLRIGHSPSLIRRDRRRRLIKLRSPTVAGNHTVTKVADIRAAATTVIAKQINPRNERVSGSPGTLS